MQTSTAWTGLLAMSALLLSAAGCLGARPGRPQQPLCQDDGACPQDQLCVYGRCRPVCQIDRDCPVGMECVEGPDGAASNVCIEPILFADDFEDGEASSWELWRRELAVVEGRLSVEDAPRAGFDYGQLGNGRMAVAHTHRGDETWTDYRVELDVESTGMGTFRDAFVDDCYRGFGVYFRVVDDSESWNEPERTTYLFGVVSADCTDETTPRGWFSLSRLHGFWIEGLGWNTPVESSSSMTLVEGIRDDAIREGANHVAVEVSGQHIEISVNDVEIVSFDDTELAAGQVPITYGGIGVYWGWESMGWVDNVVVTALPDGD